MESLSRTDRSEWGIVADLYEPLRRFAAVVAPLDLDPDDLLQESLLSVLRARRLGDVEYPEAYLRRVIVNAATSHNRRMGIRRRVMARYRAGVEANTSPSYPSDLSDLEQLPPRERGAIYLHEVEGLRYSDVAEMLGCSESAARKAGMRGRRRLHDLYVEEVAG